VPIAATICGVSSPVLQGRVPVVSPVAALTMRYRGAPWGLAHLRAATVVDVGRVFPGGQTENSEHRADDCDFRRALTAYGLCSASLT
jgi:hypothetical protein